MPTLELFLATAVNYTERRFWIARTYDRLVRSNILKEYPAIPRALRKAPYLEVVAEVWFFENKNRRDPGEEELRQMFYKKA